MNNRKTIRSSALILIWMCVIAVLAGCTSMQKLPQPGSAEETLVVVPVVIIDGKYSAFTGKISYQIKLENIDTRKIESFFLSTDSHGFSYIKGIPEGKYLIKEYTTTGMSNNDAKAISLDNYLTVGKGKLGVFPGKLVVYIYDFQGDENRSYLYPAIRDIDEKQMTRIIDFLKTDENYRLWNK